MRTLLTIAAMTCGIMTAGASIPEGYYAPLDGKSGQTLAEAIENLSSGHDVVTYGTGSWDVFTTTDVRTIQGREAWYDMYSNQIVYLPEHSALNIEHSVANSWWGGKNGNLEAYSDIFHLNPSDQNANNAKSNYPPGMVADARLLDNGVLKVGTPVNGQGGGASSVFEPADEYKGDFARAYFYVFTTYADISWSDEYAYVYADGGQFQQWAIDLLLSWHRADPVDSRELARNDEVYAVQNNRNPFIDYPELAEFVWGDKSGESFSLSHASPARAVNRPEAPVFDNAWLTAVNTYTLRWWDGIAQQISYDGGTLMLSIDGREFYEPTTAVIEIDPAESATQTHVYRAYVTAEVDGYELRSPIATLTAVAQDPTIDDYSGAEWDKVGSLPSSLTDRYYLLLSSNTLHVMSIDGGTSSRAFMPSAGFVKFNGERITELPTEAAIVSFESVGSGKYQLKVNNRFGEYIGSWNATAKNKMQLKSTYTPGTPVVNDKGEFVFTFDEYGSLQFNKTQPRFLNYSSNQTPVYLYSFTGWPENVGISAPSVDDDWAVGIDSEGLYVPEGAVVFDLGGRRVSEKGLSSGVYIVVFKGKSVKIII